MSDAAISSILSQIRSLQSQATLRPAPASESIAPAADAGGFGESLKRAIARVNGEQNEAVDLARKFELGDPDASLSRVMLAQQSAQLSFRATVEMRNRLVQAYQDVMNMPL